MRSAGSTQLAPAFTKMHGAQLARNRTPQPQQQREDGELRNASVQPGELMKKRRAPKDTPSRPVSRQHGVGGSCDCTEWKNGWLSELPLMMCGWFST